MWLPKCQRSVDRAEESHLPREGFSSATLLAMMPAFAIFYILLVLPFFPDDGKGRVENILFWPIVAGLVLTLIFQNRAQIDHRFFRSLPIMSLIAYLVFAAASVTWAFSPDFAFSRLVVQVLALIVVVLPYALPARAKHAIPGVLSLLRYRTCHQRSLCPDDAAVPNRSSRIFYPQAGVGPACRDRHYLVEL